MLDALWVADALVLCSFEPDAVDARLRDVEAQALLEGHLDAVMDWLDELELDGERRGEALALGEREAAGDNEAATLRDAEGVLDGDDAGLAETSAELDVRTDADTVADVELHPVEVCDGAEERLVEPHDVGSVLDDSEPRVEPERMPLALAHADSDGDALALELALPTAVAEPTTVEETSGLLNVLALDDGNAAGDAVMQPLGLGVDVGTPLLLPEALDTKDRDPQP